ncbi:MAG: DUF4279 domain-containing protein [Desulfobacterales bacterium]|nr:DUF4279 domain-containing protein [Desulfobacterales bacterium]
MESDAKTYFAFSASLRIFSEIPDLNKITKQLGIQPTRTQRKGVYMETDIFLRVNGLKRKTGPSRPSMAAAEAAPTSYNKAYTFRSVFSPSDTFAFGIFFARGMQKRRQSLTRPANVVCACRYLKCFA